VREGVHDLNPRDGQAEHGVKSGQILADVRRRQRIGTRAGSCAHMAAEVQTRATCVPRLLYASGSTVRVRPFPISTLSCLRKDGHTRGLDKARYVVTFWSSSIIRSIFFRSSLKVTMSTSR
jgi:hypothetical protein